MWDIFLHSWKYVDELEVEDLGNNVFFFTLAHPHIWEIFFKRGPWNIRGQLLVL